MTLDASQISDKYLVIRPTLDGRNEGLEPLRRGLTAIALETIMASNTLQAGLAPANASPESLERREGESSQQHANRLLAAARRGVSMEQAHPQVINEPASDRLEEGSLAVEYAFALCHAILDKVEILQGLHGKRGVQRNDNTAGHLDTLATLCSLQLDKLIDGKAMVKEAQRGWPTTAGCAR